MDDTMAGARIIWSIYECPRCGRRYTRMGVYVGPCNVDHPSGECCHYGEFVVDPPASSTTSSKMVDYR